MTCPFCNNDMTSVYLQNIRGVDMFYSTSLHKFINGGSNKNDIPISINHPFKGSYCNANVCVKCHKLIIDINNN
ncbi:MAG: hypothetical protein E7262_10695 [Lachnospiraceae bacterium]|nr:hypothetical protein [Lachnospiraceae bacterium]